MNAMQMAVYCTFMGVDNEKGQSSFMFSPDVTGFVNVCDELMLWVKSTHVHLHALINLHAHLALYKKNCVCVHSCMLLYVYSTKLYFFPRY